MHILLVLHLFYLTFFKLILMFCADYTHCILVWTICCTTRVCFCEVCCRWWLFGLEKRIFITSQCLRFLVLTAISIKLGWILGFHYQSLRQTPSYCLHLQKFSMHVNNLDRTPSLLEETFNSFKRFGAWNTINHKIMQIVLFKNVWYQKIFKKNQSINNFYRLACTLKLSRCCSKLSKITVTLTSFHFSALDVMQHKSTFT